MDYPHCLYMMATTTKATWQLMHNSKQVCIARLLNNPGPYMHIIIYDNSCIAEYELS